jgi:pre-mRNA-processing factor 6
VTLDPDFGDAWAHFYKFEQINGSKDNTDVIIQRVKKAQPRHGKLVSSCSNLKLRSFF